MKYDLTTVNQSIAREIAGGKIVESDEFVNHGKAIVVLSNGFIYTGTALTDGVQCVIVDGFNVRSHQGGNGLGWYAIHGFKHEHVTLDKAGVVWCPIAELKHLIICKEENYGVEFDD